MDLESSAIIALQESGFEPIAPPEVLQAATSSQSQLATVDVDEQVDDLQSMLWSSIDNRDSLDLDQIAIVEQRPHNILRMHIGIADVDCLVPGGSSLDAWAARNATSVYTGVRVFPMLPERLSNDLTSLNEGQKRLALVISFDISAEGDLGSTQIRRAIVRNHKRLEYDSLGRWLEGQGELPTELLELPDLREQILLQQAASQRLNAERLRRGALDLETTEVRPVVVHGQVVDLEVPHKNPARLMIENTMVAANSIIARFLEDHGYTQIQRLVRSPERWDRIAALAAERQVQLPAQADQHALAAFLHKQRETDPLGFAELSLAIVKLLGASQYEVIRPGEESGHFGLAVSDYTHATAPNRRYVDIIVQRQLKAALLDQENPYADLELESIARHCTARQQAARGIERRVRKIAATNWVQSQLGEEFMAIVTGVSSKGSFVRLLDKPVEGRVIQGEQGLDVGQRVRVRLVDIHPARGWIDFVRA